MSTEEIAPPEINILNLNVVSLKRFVFAVRTISQNDLWDEVLEELDARGCHSIALSVEPIEAMKDALRQRLPDRPKKAKGGRRDQRDDPRRAAPQRKERGDDPLSDFPDMNRPQRHLERFMASACGTPPVHYPPRPPEDWPEGPWDPQQ
ncbi:hypothetical protein ACFYXJ_15965 [Streptomyces sp. NPDC002667]|uniref:hypothetical protein n=1 Tax=Streptomyces sp. NPDC002667 TaxID=3364657 RepID=UPI0036A4B3F3